MCLCMRQGHDGGGCAPEPQPPDPDSPWRRPGVAPLWRKFVHWVVRLAFKRKLWHYLGDHLNYYKAVARPWSRASASAGRPTRDGAPGR